MEYHSSGSVGHTDAENAMPSPQTIVVGAGIAGLTAAYQLKKAGHEVVVLEAASHVGGRMFTVDWEGFRVDGGAKFVTTSDRSLLAMIREVGLESQLVRSDEGPPSRSTATARCTRPTSSQSTPISPGVGSR
jgi:protoporphyrinogen oxidase